MNLDFEAILFFFQTYKRWPNEIEKHYIEQMLNSPYNSVSQIYEPLFDKIKYKKMILNSAQVYEITNLLIDFIIKINVFHMQMKNIKVIIYIISCTH